MGNNQRTSNRNNQRRAMPRAENPTERPVQRYTEPWNNRREYVPRENKTRANYPEYEDAYSEDSLQESGWVQHKKKIIIAAGIIGGLALAIGIGEIISNAGKVKIVNVQPAFVSAQQPYQDCRQVGTTRYSRNHKNGTEGAIIGGVGGAAVGGLVTHSWVGAGVGAAVGAVGGDLIQRSNQPDYVAHHGSTTQCQTAYRPIQVPIGYQAGYLNSDDTISQIITQHQPMLGSKVDLKILQGDQVSPQQQQYLVQQAINGNQAAAAPVPNSGVVQQ